MIPAALFADPTALVARSRMCVFVGLFATRCQHHVFWATCPQPGQLYAEVSYMLARHAPVSRMLIPRNPEPTSDRSQPFRRLTIRRSRCAHTLGIVRANPSLLYFSQRYDAAPSRALKSPAETHPLQPRVGCFGEKNRVIAEETRGATAPPS